MVNAISAVAESFYDDRNTVNMDNAYLTKWGKYDFSGEETFPVVSSQFKSKNKTLGEYVSLIKKIPLISSFIKVKSMYRKEIYMISLFMTLDCFRKYTAENFCATVDVTSNVNECIDDTGKQEVIHNIPKRRLPVVEEATKNAQIQEDKEKKIGMEREIL